MKMFAPIFIVNISFFKTRAVTEGDFLPQHGALTQKKLVLIIIQSGRDRWSLKIT